MVTIAVEIDCDGEYCGNCEHFVLNVKSVECTQFNKVLTHINSNAYAGDYLRNINRCQQCLDATIKD